MCVSAWVAEARERGKQKARILRRGMSGAPPLPSLSFSLIPMRGRGRAGGAQGNPGLACGGVESGRLSLARERAGDARARRGRESEEGRRGEPRARAGRAARPSPPPAVAHTFFRAAPRPRTPVPATPLARTPPSPPQRPCVSLSRCVGKEKGGRGRGRGRGTCAGPLCFGAPPLSPPPQRPRPPATGLAHPPPPPQAGA